MCFLTFYRRRTTACLLLIFSLANQWTAARQQSCDQRTWLSVSKGLMTLGRANWSMTIQSPAIAASTCGQSHAAATHTGQKTLNQRSNDANEKSALWLFHDRKTAILSKLSTVHYILNRKVCSVLGHTELKVLAAFSIHTSIVSFCHLVSIAKTTALSSPMLCPNWTVYTNCKYIHI